MHKSLLIMSMKQGKEQSQSRGLTNQRDDIDKIPEASPWTHAMKFRLLQMSPIHHPQYSGWGRALESKSSIPDMSPRMISWTSFPPNLDFTDLKSPRYGASTLVTGQQFPPNKDLCEAEQTLLLQSLKPNLSHFWAWHRRQHIQMKGLF